MRLIRRTRVAIAIAKRNDVYQLMIGNLLKAIGSVIALIVAFLLVKNFLLAGMDQYGMIFSTNPVLMYSLFFASESFLGVLPPDLFILWITQVKPFIPQLFLLAVLSFVGGLISYQIGRSLSHTPFIRKMHVRYFRKYNRHIDEWGGVIIIISAMTPLPFSPVSMISGSLQFPFKKYVAFAATRFIRYAVYGWIFWNVAV